MDRVDEYRELVRRLLLEQATIRPAYGDLEMQTILDEERGHYLLMCLGWEGNRRVRGPVLQIDLKGSKIWIQHDGTEEGFANSLVAAGVPKGDIVLAYHAPSLRPLTGFATGEDPGTGRAA